jgi:hypothetical protein
MEHTYVGNLVLCATPNCQNLSNHVLCLSCSAQEVSHRLLQAAEGTCLHGHSITGDYGMIMRLLPEYQGSQPQAGYMLDVCKICLQELRERPYRPGRPGRGH